MPELVALGIHPGPGFVDALRSVWDAGDAAAPLDPRLPPAAARARLRTLEPTLLVEAGGATTRLRADSRLEAGDALVMATSGSSGSPRAVVLTRQAVEASARATTERLGVDPARHHWLACLPLAHIGGLSVVTRAILTGTPLTVLPGFDAETVARIGRAREASHVSLVATALQRVDAGLFTRVLLGGSAPPGSLPENVVTTYGMTETGSGVVYDGIPLEGVEITTGTGEPGGGAEGEILVRGPMLLRVYRDGSDPRIPGPDGRGGWLPTGDGGRVAADGRLHVRGRLAEVIVTGAEKVWPADVERVLSALPAVAEVAVWKRPDPEWGDRVVAWVVPADPAEPPGLGALRGAVAASELAPWSAPKEIEIVGSLPRTGPGKVKRSELR